MSNRTKRDNMKRKVSQSHRKLDAVMLDIKILYDLFEPVHPNLGESLEVAAETALLCQQLLEAFAKEAWNMEVSSIQKFL